MRRTPSLTHLRPEARLLAAALRPGGHGEATRLLARESPDWTRLRALAQRERALPVVWHWLAGIGDPGCTEAAEELRDLALVWEFRLRRLEERLAESLAALKAAALPEPLLLKGAACAASVYGSIRERPMADIDLLLAPEHARAAWRVLREAGWRPAFGGRRDEFYDGHLHLEPLDDGAGTRVRLEVHTRLYTRRGRFDVSVPDLRARARRARVAGVQCLIPAPEDLLLHSCVHFAWGERLRRGGWRTFRDLARVAERGVDWETLARRAGGVGAATCVGWTLRLARSLGIPAGPHDLPAGLGARVRPSTLDRALESFLLRDLFVLREDRGPGARFQSLAWEAAIRPRSMGHGGNRPWESWGRTRTAWDRLREAVMRGGRSITAEETGRTAAGSHP